jgi:hypothetical protein
MINLKYESARKCQPKCNDERVAGRQTIHNLVNILRTTGLLKKIPWLLVQKQTVMTELSALVVEVSADFCRLRIPPVVNLSFLDPSFTVKQN